MSVFCAWAGRFAGQHGGHEEQHGQESVAAEDVAHGELVVAVAHRREPRRELGQRGGGGQDGGAEQDTGQADVVGDGVAAAFQYDAGGESDQGSDTEDGR
jgi:hypothetical protein